MTIEEAVTKILALLAPNASRSGTSSELEYVVIGVALLLGTISDEVVMRRSLRRTM